MLEFRMVSGQVIKIEVGDPKSELEKIYNGSKGAGLIKFDVDSVIINIGNIESIKVV
mgnify:CR=1 FL=1